MRYCALVLAAVAIACGSPDSSDIDYPRQARSGVTAAATERYIVVLTPAAGDPEAAARALLRAHGGTLGFVYRHAMSGFSAELPPAAVEAIARNPNVAYVEPDQVMTAFAQTVPTGVRRIFADSNANLDIDGIDDGRVDVDVAVIDTGIDFDHPDLNVVGRVDCSRGSALRPSCSEETGDDGNGHGTHVAGTIGAIDNGFGVVGVAPGARLWAVKVLSDSGSGWTSGIIAGVDWVTAKSKVIEVANMSLGGGNSTALCQAVNSSVAAGIVHAVAAGNSDANASAYSPANCSGVITVSALADFDGLPGASGGATCRADQDDTLADFSNWGSTVEIAAPGVCIQSTWKDGGYATISGTSMASPHVAGAAALLRASGVGTPAQVRTTLLARGNFIWTDDSGDGVTEPLLDVSSATTFEPVMVAGAPPAPGETPPPDETPPPETTPPEAITLSATPYKVKGVQHVTLLWSGATSATVDVYRDGDTIAPSVPSDVSGATYDDNIGEKGGGSYVYRVCEATTSTCSGAVTVTF
jgi:subtilisin family serine protease